MRTHWVIFYADRGDLALQFHSQTTCVQAIFRFRVRHVEKSCDKIAQPDWLTLGAIRSDERKNRARCDSNYFFFKQNVKEIQELSRYSETFSGYLEKFGEFQKERNPRYANWVFTR